MTLVGKKNCNIFFYCQRGLSASISPIVLYYAVHSNENISPARYSPLLLGQNAPLISHDGWLSRQCVFVWLTSIFKCYKILKEYIDYTPLEYSQCSPSVLWMLQTSGVYFKLFMSSLIIYTSNAYSKIHNNKFVRMETSHRV